MTQKLKFEEVLKMHNTLQDVFMKTNHFFTDVDPHDTRMLFFLKQTNSKSILEVKKAFLEKMGHGHNSHELKKFEVKIAKMAKALTDKGYLKLTNDSSDRRIKNFVITPQGEKIYADYMAKAEEIWNESNSI